MDFLRKRLRIKKEQMISNVCIFICLQRKRLRLKRE